MFLAILKRAISFLNRLCLWSLLPMFIGIIIIMWQSFIGTNQTILVWGWVLSWVWLPPMILSVILYLVLMAVRGVDLLSTEPAVAEVISVKRTGVFINSVPQLAVTMRVKGRNVVTECRVLDYVGPALGDVYNIKIRRLNPAVAKIVNPADAEVAYS